MKIKLQLFWVQETLTNIKWTYSVNKKKNIPNAMSLLKTWEKQYYIKHILASLYFAIVILKNDATSSG